MEFKIDLHIHTIYSDGTMEPVDVVTKFKDEGYDIIAITDHDGIGGIREAQIAGKALKIEVLPGIEFSSEYVRGGKMTELHILGYRIDPSNQRLREKCEFLRKTRADRNVRMLARLREMGYEITEADLPDKPGGYIGKPDVVRALLAKGYEIEDPFALLEGIPRERISTEEAIEIIREAGGTPVLAHPFKIRELRPREEGFRDRLDPLLRDLKKMGIRGLECFHPSADHDESLMLVELAEKYHLNITKGSDFHGDKEPLQKH